MIHELRAVTEWAQGQALIDPARKAVYDRVVAICREADARGQRGSTFTNKEGKSSPVASFSSGMNKTQRIELAHAAINLEIQRCDRQDRAVYLSALNQIRLAWYDRDWSRGAKVTDL
jgi:hypothetical protein